jgi:Tfp pilus assembly major pilin PilA
MGPNPSQYEELYRAAVGESKAHYYVPRFQRFDEGSSRASWNWPAFFVSFFWMLYRRMYGPALIYWFAWPTVMLMLGGLISALLGPLAGGIAYALLIAAQLILVPMFANALYHWHIRNRIKSAAGGAPSHEAVVQRLGRNSGGAPVVVAVAAVVGVFFMGILAAIAIPAYQDYTIRSQVAEGLGLAAPVKASVAQVYSQSNTWPADLQSVGADAAPQGKYVTGVEVSDGTILIRYGNAAHAKISGRTLSLQPVEGTEGVVWMCGYSAGTDATQTDIEPKYLPTACRTTTAVQTIDRQ